MHYTQLMLTRKCNQRCFYCTTNKRIGLEEVDIDFLKHVLDNLHTESGVELTGGEIGLIKNIDEVYKIVKDHKHIKHIKVLSNGLIRKIGVDWIKDVEYWEHLIYEIKGKEIIKFYQDLDLEQDHTYIIVTTETTTYSLLNNWKYFEEMGLFRPNFDYKIMNHKLAIPQSFNDAKFITHYWNELFKLYSKLNNRYFLMMLIDFLNDESPVEKELCQKYSPNVYIDFQNKVIGHCAMNVLLSNKVEYSKENFQKMINGDFSENYYCKKCYSWDCGKNRSKYNNRSYKI